MMSGETSLSAFPDGDNIFQWTGTIAGGDGTISGLGDARVNSSIGSQWRHGRADQLRQNAENAKKAGAEKMDVELEICPEDEGGGAGTSSPSTSGPGSPGSGTGDVPMS